jgi:hypothetical protein
MSSMYCQHRCKFPLHILSLTVADTVKYLGGFKGDWEDAPSSQNQQSKLKLLAGEGVTFDEKGMLIDRKLFWSDFKA